MKEKKKDFKDMLFLKNLFNIFLLAATASLFNLSCTDNSNKENISGDFFQFDPQYRGGSKTTQANGTPLPPIKINANSSKGVVTVQWETPKSYLSETINVGYRVFRKRQSDPNYSTWDFNSAISEDWTFEIGTLEAKKCQKSGICRVADPVGGPFFVSYAVIAYWDITDFSSNQSAPAVVSLTSEGGGNGLSFDEGFMEDIPIFIIGKTVAEVDRTPSFNVFNFDAEKLPWYMMEADKGEFASPSYSRLATPLFVGHARDNLSIMIPESPYHRITYASRGDKDECNAYPENLREFCRQLNYTRPYIPFFPLGQKSVNQAKSFLDNDLPTSRKFIGVRSTSIQVGPSGAEYLFVADEARILVRKTPVGPCADDIGEVAGGRWGVEGPCGYQWSIGTYSPRHRCAWRADGSVAVGGGECSEADMNYSLSDSTAPSQFSLRYPSAPIVVGKHLYIPDAGNARILRLANFEDAFKTCGKLLPAGSSDSNDLCRFDMVLGQVGNTSDDPLRFTYRSCIRGGERGGKDGGTDLPSTALFSDPLVGLGNGGAACRTDMITETIDGKSYLRRKRLAGDFRDEARSDISPDTGLLSDSARRRFRSPLHIERDDQGRLYVLDMGYTLVRSAVGNTAATLPPRIMVWRRDPFSYQKCVPIDPMAAVPSCKIDENNVCSGRGCVDRECVDIECNANVFLGQRSELFGFTHTSEQRLGESVSPQGYYPIVSFAVGHNEGLKGVWAVGGKDNKVYHWKELSQSTPPIVHNARPQSEAADITFKRGVFSGITIDSLSGIIIGWDTKLNIGIAWSGSSKASE